MRPVTSALITGASSGIGHALAVALAGSGVHLHLSGRDTERLDRVAETCRSRGATVAPKVLDVRDRDAMHDWVMGTGNLDLVIANAAIAAGIAGGAAERPDQTRALFETNLDGAMNAILPAMAAMRAQPPAPDGVRGRIAVIASVAAFLPLPGAASYCATKAALDTWVVASAPAARREGIRLTSVCPGFVRTPMTDNNGGRMPGLIEPEEAARRILIGIAAHRVRIVFPWWMGLAARLGGLVPPRVLAAAVSRKRR
jgi:NADP-dependent 3-hydroxy acid dehydrogenase YdfG